MLAKKTHTVLLNLETYKIVKKYAIEDKRPVSRQLEFIVEEWHKSRKSAS